RGGARRSARVRWPGDARGAGRRVIHAVARQAARDRARARGIAGRAGMKRVLEFIAWLAAAAAALFLVVQLSFLARVWWWKDHNPQSTAFMDASLARMRASRPDARLSHAWVS